MAYWALVPGLILALSDLACHLSVERGLFCFAFMTESRPKTGDQRNLKRKTGDQRNLKRKSDTSDGRKNWNNKKKTEEEEVQVVGADYTPEHESESSCEDDIDQDSIAKRDKQDMLQKLQVANRKGSKSGDFKSMGLSTNVLKAIQHKGYKIPTPIQRKVLLPQD